MTDAGSEYDSRYFATRFTYDRDREFVWQEVCRYLQPREIPADSLIVEIGAGYCSFINNVQARERHAVDLSPDLAQHAAPGVVPHVGSCTALSMFSAGTVDVVFASNLFEHLTRDELASTLTEIRRVLRPGGRLVIVQPNFRYSARHYFDDYTHLQVFTDVSLRDRLMADSFRIRRVVPRFLPFSMKSRLPKSRLLVRLYLRSPLKPFGAQMLIVAEKP
jgi:SAM-dependent methyltransferase